MKTNKLIFFLILFLLLAIACQSTLIPSINNPQDEIRITHSLAVTHSNKTDNETTQNPDLSLSDNQQQSGIPSPTKTFTPLPSATIPLSTSTPQPTDLPYELQLSIFEELWSIVDKEYLYPDFNGLDWNAIYDEFQAQIESGLTNSEFYRLMDEMISRLGDDHSGFVTPEEVLFENAEFEGNADYVGVGILVTALPERDRAVILVVFPDSPAARAGLRSRDSILSADGEPILDENGSLRDIVRGPEGTQVTLMIQSPQGEPYEVELTRQRITGSLPVLSTQFEIDDGRTIGYIQIVTFADGMVDEQVRNALFELSKESGLDGLILDNRLNNGGASSVMTPILSYFTSGTLGYFVSREGKYPLTIKEPENINGSMSYPLVVLISDETISFGEIFSGILQDLDRAYLIGETTLGNIETLWGYDFADGSRAWIAHDSFIPYNDPNADWEKSGISPNLSIEGKWYDFTLEDDPVIDAAINYLVNLYEQ